MIHGVVKYGFCRSRPTEIALHLRGCDDSFMPPLSTRVEIDEYAWKLFGAANRFEAWADGELVGLSAVYSNSVNRNLAFLTNISVSPAWRGLGIASRLLDNSIEKVRELGFLRLELEVNRSNRGAITLYEKRGFLSVEKSGPGLKMVLDL